MFLLNVPSFTIIINKSYIVINRNFSLFLNCFFYYLKINFTLSNKARWPLWVMYLMNLFKRSMLLTVYFILLIGARVVNVSSAAGYLGVNVLNLTFLMTSIINCFFYHPIGNKFASILWPQMKHVRGYNILFYFVI